MGEQAVLKVWKRMYALARMSAPSEKQQKAFRLAVYAYCVVNGSSREGKYTGTMVLNDGTVVDAAVIPQAATKMHVRKFLRGNMKESYEALKMSGVIEEDERYVAKVAAFGVAPEAAFATADWMADCPHFTPSENRAHLAARDHGLQRSRRARGGQSLEDVERERLSDDLDAQGSLDPPMASGRVQF